MRLIQLLFLEGELPEELTLVKMFLIPSGKEEYWGIGIVEVACKVCALVLNLRLKKALELHDSLYGFWEGCVMGVATLEDNMDQ